MNIKSALDNIQASAVTLERGGSGRESRAIFHDVLRNTGSPARAVQATLATIHQMGYYD